MYRNTEAWKDSVPSDLISAVTHLRGSFEDAHWGCGRTTERFCSSILHGTKAEDCGNEYLDHLVHMEQRVGPAATAQLHRLLKQGTLSSVFKGFFDLYVESLGVQVALIFKELVGIGRANRSLLTVSFVDWAEAQTKNLIRSHTHEIPSWVRRVCDEQTYDPEEDFDDYIFWRKWRAPMFLVMQPSGPNKPFDPVTAWQRGDVETSSRWLEHFTNQYVLRLESRLEQLAGMAGLEEARVTATLGAELVGGLRSEEPHAASTRPRSAKREVRKLDTQERYRGWRKAYRSLKKRRPDMSDVWYSQQIAKLEIAKGATAETIRKHMTG